MFKLVPHGRREVADALERVVIMLCAALLPCVSFVSGFTAFDQPQIVRLRCIPYFLALYVLAIVLWTIGRILRANTLLRDVALGSIIVVFLWYFSVPMVVE